jgi:hypothetical protein
MKIKIPRIENGKVRYKTKEVGATQLSVLNGKNVHTIYRGGKLILDWKYSWMMIDNQDEWEEGKMQEKMLRDFNLL